MQFLSRGSRGLAVQLLQRFLNKAEARDGISGTQLNTDGEFGALTESALYAFQKRHPGLIADKIAGTQTWRALGLRTEMIHTRVQLLAQYSAGNCWSAAASMILGNQSVGHGSAKLSKKPKEKDALLTTLGNHIAFAKSLGWEALNYSPTVRELVDIVCQTPVWMSAGGVNWGHVVVLSGVYSDGDEAGDGTLFRIHDPWPVGVGRIYGSFANPISFRNNMSGTPTPARMYQIIVPR
ncbi:MAG: peptidoglycan-binding protein [Burkholderiaceae bacterium]|nr:peptidoglycan-binding protein [Burkholderiaceae bacterium]